MKTLLLLRHAKSSWKDSALNDVDRPLNGRGKRDAPRMGALLRQQGLLPEVLLCSPAKRARQTAEAVIEASGFEGELQTVSSLYGAGPEEYLELLHNLPDRCASAMLVGHNPGMEEFLDELTGAGEHMPTAALAQIELLVQSWEEVDQETEGQLLHLWTPRSLE